MSKKTAFKTWDSYVTEATKPPFELPVSETETIKIEAPSGQQVIDAQRQAANGDLEEQLRTICGDAADEVLPLVKKAPGEVMGALVTDIMAHFGYGGSGKAPTSRP